jgi:predicted LPLAT superfamily acyltransferase
LLARRLFNALTDLGVWAAVVLFREPRRNSRDYLTAVLGRRPSLRDTWRHYREFTTMHMVRLRAAAGLPHLCRPLPSCDDFTALMRSGRPALLGSFHIGNSDLLGFFLGQYPCHVHMVRFRLGDSVFLSQFADKSHARLSFIWVNEQENLLFAIKQAVQSGGSIAMKCDRVGYSAKLEAFEFLGAQRWFPFTIYHLGILFEMPVTFCVGSPAGSDRSDVRGFPVFEPNGDSKAMNLQRARAHFQQVLTEIEASLRANPYLWFNFDPLNPVATRMPAPIAFSPLGARLAPVPGGG